MPKRFCHSCNQILKGRGNNICLKCKLKLMDELKDVPTEEDVEDAKDIIEELGDEEELDEEEEEV
jgi:hypothetical protein